jgi:hypothetical protein
MSANITIAVSTGATSATLSEAFVRRAARIAAVLFVLATASTMADQMTLDGLQGEVGEPDATRSGLVSLAVTFEIMNGLASAGIALALYPVLRHVSELAATGYLGLRVVEGALGVAAAAGLMMIMVPQQGNSGWAMAYHDATFLLVLIVFSCGTFCFYPVLFKYRLVPPVLSLWGIIGGLTLLISCLLILFGRIEIGGTTDLILSLPIWINEMVLAVWLFIRGFDLSAVQSEAAHAT